MYFLYFCYDYLYRVLYFFRFIFRPIEESAYFYFTQMIKRDELLKNQNQVTFSCKVV